MCHCFIFLKYYNANFRSNVYFGLYNFVNDLYYLQNSQNNESKTILEFKQFRRIIMFLVKDLYCNKIAWFLYLCNYKY